MKTLGANGDNSLTTLYEVHRVQLQTFPALTENQRALL